MKRLAFITLQHLGWDGTTRLSLVLVLVVLAFAVGIIFIYEFYLGPRRSAGLKTLVGGAWDRSVSLGNVGGAHCKSGRPFESRQG